MRELLFPVLDLAFLVIIATMPSVRASDGVGGGFGSGDGGFGSVDGGFGSVDRNCNGILAPSGGNGHGCGLFPHPRDSGGFHLQVEASSFDAALLPDLPIFAIVAFVAILLDEARRARTALGSLLG